MEDTVVVRENSHTYNDFEDPTYSDKDGFTPIRSVITSKGREYEGEYLLFEGIWRGLRWRKSPWDHQDVWVFLFKKKKDKMY